MRNKVAKYLWKKGILWNVVAHLFAVAALAFERDGYRFRPLLVAQPFVNTKFTDEVLVWLACSNFCNQSSTSQFSGERLGLHRGSALARNKYNFGQGVLIGFLDELGEIVLTLDSLDKIGHAADCKGVHSVGLTFAVVIRNNFVLVGVALIFFGGV